MCFYDMSITLCFGNHIQVLQLFFVWKMMPETKGVALEDMEVRVGH